MAQRESRMSATEARVHFGEVIQRVENGESIIVERSGKAAAVVISVEDYQRARLQLEEKPDWFELARQSRERIAQDLDGKPLPVNEIFDRMREDRDAQHRGDLYRRNYGRWN